MATGYNMRVGDADREGVAAQLRDGYADGRLTLDELNERLDKAFAAKTRGDLDALLQDLPHTARPTAAGPYPAIQPPGASWGQENPGWSRRPPVFAPLLGMVWLFVLIGSVFVFGLGGGERPIAIVLFIAAFALLRRLFGLGRRRAYGRTRGPRGPRGPRGRRRC
jgi:hypothetical protein